MEDSRIALEEFQRVPRVTSRGRERILSDLEVKDILLDPRVMRVIAEERGISRTLVAKIKNRTASYFFDREHDYGQTMQTQSNLPESRYQSVATPNMTLVTLPVVVAPVGHPTILEESDVAEIKRDARTLREIAEDRGISISTVWRVRNGEYQGRSRDARSRDERVAVASGKPLYESDLRSARKGKQ